MPTIHHLLLLGALVGACTSKVDDEPRAQVRDATQTADVPTVPKALVIEVKTDSVQVEPERLRDHLKLADFFDTAKYPEARFTSVSMTPKADGTSTHAVEGALNLHGEKKVVTFPATLTVDAKTATGHAELTINRKDFGVDAGLADALVEDDVLLKFDLTFTR